MKGYKWKTRTRTAALSARSQKAGGRTILLYWTGEEIPVFEGVLGEGEESVEKHLLSCFAAAGQCESWLSLTPKLSTGSELPAWYGFQTEGDLYLSANAGISQALFLWLMKLAEFREASRLYMAVHRDLPSFSHVIRVMLCLGFKQVDLLDQHRLCIGPAVLFERQVK